MGSNIGKDSELISIVTQVVKEVATVPVWAKLTPSTTDIVVEARGAFLGGADAISSSNTFPSLPLDRSGDARVRDERRWLRLERRARRSGHPAAVDGEDGAADAGVSRQGVLRHRRRRRVRPRAQLLPARVRHGAGLHGGDARPGDRAERDPAAERRAWRRRWTSNGWSSLEDFRGLRRDRVVTHSQIRRPDAKAYHGGYEARRLCQPRHDARTSSRRLEDLSTSPLWNRDLAPTPLAQRTWSTYHIAALWIGMSVVITTYTLASGLMQQGMTWWQAMLTILLGNTLVLVPMILNAHAGTKYGISFPVLCRASFGVRGANVPAILRALVACGWFGIQTWIGGLALSTLIAAAWPGWAAIPAGNAIALRHLLGDSGMADRARPRGHQEARGLVGAAAPRRRRAAAALGDPPRRRARVHPEPIGQAADGERAVLAAVPRRADGERRLLGDAQPEHPRLHPLRAQPALAGARPGDGTAGDDDGVRVHRRGRDQRDDRDFRRGDLGSGRADRPHRQPARHHLRRARRAAGAADHQHGRERRVARRTTSRASRRVGSAT